MRKPQTLNLPLKAYCYSYTCTATKAPNHSQAKPHDVKQGTRTCPVCTYALVWRKPMYTERRTV